MDEEVLHIIVSGRVQGVGFRDYTESVARRLGVPGWVRNLPTGQVEILARVKSSQKAAWLAKIRAGPPLSRVQGLEVKSLPESSGCPAAGFTTRG